jgi:hypothetical protein
LCAVAKRGVPGKRDVIQRPVVGGDLEGPGGIAAAVDRYIFERSAVELPLA